VSAQMASQMAESLARARLHGGLFYRPPRLIRANNAAHAELVSNHLKGRGRFTVKLVAAPWRLT
jgi:hypothetical protein